MRRFPVAVALPLLLLLAAGCGVVASDPSIQEVQGWVDTACTSAPATSDISCGVHLILLNKGGAGSGFMSVVVPVNGAGGSTAKPVQCIAPIPAMAGGDYTETSCSVVLAKGTVVAAPPQIVSLTVGAENSAASDPSTLIAVLIALAALNLVALLWVGFVIRGLRGRPTSAATAPSPAAAPATRRGRDDPDADYNLPRLPQ